MRNHNFTKTYNIHEIHRMEASKRHVKANLHGKHKKFHDNEIVFDRALTQEIEDLILHPFADESLKDFTPSPLVSYEHEYARKMVAAKKKFYEYIKKIEKGIKALKKVGLWVEQDTSHPLFNLPDNPDTYQKALEADKPLQEILNISDHLMKQSYEEACKQYRNKHYTECENILELLLYLNPSISIYWQLLGMAEHGLGHLEAAIETLTTGLQEGSSSLIPYVHLINCLIDLQQINEANQVIHAALNIEHPIDSNAHQIRQALIKLEQALIRR